MFDSDPRATSASLLHVPVWTCSNRPRRLCKSIHDLCMTWSRLRMNQFTCTCESTSQVVRLCKMGPNSTQIAFCCGNFGVETLSHRKTCKMVVNVRKKMLLEIFQLSISDETHLKRFKRLEIYWKFQSDWSFCLHSRSYFQGNFQTLKVG